MRLTLRDALKGAARALAHVIIVPWWASFAIRSRLIDPDRALMASMQMLALLPGLPGQYLRRAFLQHAIAACHHTVVVEWGTTLSRTGARLEKDVYVGPGCHLGLVHIGQGALVAAGVHIPSGGTTHGISDLSVAIRDQPGQERMVRIGAGTWIGSASVVMADVGENAVIGAGSVVTRELPSAVVAAGVPASILRDRRPARRVV